MEKEEKKTQKLTVIDKRKLQPENSDEEKSIGFEIPPVGEKLPMSQINKVKQVPTDLPIKKTLTEQLAERKLKKQATKQARVNKVSCPNCKYIGIGDGFLFNPQLHAMICPKCGVFFMETRLRQKVLEDIKRKQESGIIVPG